MQDSLQKGPEMGVVKNAIPKVSIARIVVINAL